MRGTLLMASSRRWWSEAPCRSERLHGDKCMTAGVEETLIQTLHHRPNRNSNPSSCQPFLCDHYCVKSQLLECPFQVQHGLLVAGDCPREDRLRTNILPTRSRDRYDQMIRSPAFFTLFYLERYELSPESSFETCPRGIITSAIYTPITALTGWVHRSTRYRDTSGRGKRRV